MKDNGKYCTTEQNGEVTINYTGIMDDVSGASHFDYYMRKDGGTRTKEYNVEQNVNGNTGYIKYKFNGYGTYVTEYLIYDKVGNASKCKEYTFIVSPSL